MHEGRKNPRYTVVHYDKVTGQIDPARPQEQLLTLSSGGCGFYGTEPTGLLKEGRRVNCSFKSPDVDAPLVIQGSILYTRPVKVEGRELILYGIQFVAEHRERIRPIIESLDRALEQGVEGLKKTA